ncbi:hypothetical protein L218DRAFT_1076036 [Marasmius fiardii PR-910]|nr:hypothetical protein L218DRAFT_1076036 [Marasmius fiardii PR-910]
MVITITERNKVLQASIMSPSQAGHDPQSHFRDNRLMTGRPIPRYSVPTAVYSPELTKIMERFMKIAEVEVMESMVHHAADLVSVTWQCSVNGGKAKPDAVWGLSMVLELKNEKGVGGNALLQTLIDRLHIIQGSKMEGKFLNSNFPCIVIAISSTLFDVSLMVMTEVLLVDDVFQIDIRGGRNLQEDTVTLARALQIITDGFGELTKYYNRIRTQDTDHGADYLLPNPICNTTLEPPSFGPLTFLNKLSARDVSGSNDALDQSTAKRLELSMNLFRARMPDNTTVMVKFTPTYNAEAHRLLEAEGLAPKLFYHEKMAGDKARNAFAYLYDDQQIQNDGLLPRSVYYDIQKALEILHQRKIVFGDVRLQNVMVQEEQGGRVGGRLVDFDNCDLEGEARYPVFLSRIAVYRDAGMEPYGKMLTKHDKFLLAKLEDFSPPTSRYAFHAFHASRVLNVSLSLKASSPILCPIKIQTADVNPHNLELVAASALSVQAQESPRLPHGHLPSLQLVVPDITWSPSPTYTSPTSTPLTPSPPPDATIRFSSKR